MKITEEVLREYKVKLIIENMLLGDEVIELDGNIHNQDFYLSPIFLIFLKSFIQKGNQNGFIDFSIKAKLLNYLNQFRDFNHRSNLEHKICIENLINECIIECNSINPKLDSDFYYAEQVSIRTAGVYDLNHSYQLIKFVDGYKNLTKNSCLNDLYYFDAYISKTITSKDEDLVSEWAMWSVNRFLYDLEDLSKHPTFLENCKNLLKVGKKSIVRNYLHNGLMVGNRIRKEQKELTKKIR